MPASRETGAVPMAKRKTGKGRRQQGRRRPEVPPTSKRTNPATDPAREVEKPPVPEVEKTPEAETRTQRIGRIVREWGPVGLQALRTALVIWGYNPFGDDESHHDH